MQDMLHLLRLEFDETPPPGSKSPFRRSIRRNPARNARKSCGHAMTQSAKDPSHTPGEGIATGPDFATQEPVRRKPPLWLKSEKLKIKSGRAAIFQGHPAGVHFVSPRSLRERSCRNSSRAPWECCLEAGW